jgi:lysylphosphatidylglycerol synthetase-like protein (DUF2156 family)
VTATPAQTPPGFSGRYRRAGRLAQITCILLGVIAFWALLSMIHEGSGQTLVDDIRAGISREKDLATFLQSSGGLARIYLGTAGLCAIAFFAWLSRTVDNLPVLAAGTPSVTPRSAIGWWFVPIVNLVKPYQLMRDLHDRVAIGTSTGGGWIVLAWWLAFILGNAVLAGTFLVHTSSTPDALSTLFGVQQIGNALILLGAILGIIVVLRIQWRTEDRADSLGVHRAARRRRLMGAG